MAMQRSRGLQQPVMLKQRFMCVFCCFYYTISLEQLQLKMNENELHYEKICASFVSYEEQQKVS